jgi:antitoxin (DNA-binding transcriptional repressor) of toxin-antitoxin stability system
MPDLINTQKMQIYTVEEFQERWDEMIARVESGEHIGITNEKNTCVMIPADEELIRIYTEENNEAP